jgi:hypothetical protein
VAVKTLDVRTANKTIHSIIIILSSILFFTCHPRRLELFRVKCWQKQENSLILKVRFEATIFYGTLAMQRIGTERYTMEL